MPCKYQFNNAKKIQTCEGFPTPYFFFNSCQSFDHLSSFYNIVSLKTKYLPFRGKFYNLKFQNKFIKPNVKNSLPIKRYSCLFCVVFFLSASDQNHVLGSFCHLILC